MYIICKMIAPKTLALLIKNSNTSYVKYLFSVCFQCRKFVDTVCTEHGDLVPCTELATGPVRKDPTKCPVPSFIKIQESNIRDAGHGVFSTQFIKPGHIIGRFINRVYSVTCRWLCVIES